MIIFGWGNRFKKEFGSTIFDKCTICSKENFFDLVRVRDWFDLFFIPIFPYNTEYHLICPNCGNGIKLENNYQIKKLKEITFLIEKFADQKISIDEKEVITQKEFEEEYEKLVKELKPPK